jgi:predicted Zn-dependent protease
VKSIRLSVVNPSRSAQFAALVAKQPANELFRFSLAQALLAEGRPADAIEHLEFCAGKKADWMMPRILLGKALVGLGRRREAKPWLEQALHLAVAQDHEDPERELRAILSDL